MQIRSRSGSSATPLRPAAAAMRPQFGSAPWTAVLTSEEEATVRATARAAASSAAPDDGDLDEVLRPPRRRPRSRSQARGRPSRARPRMPRGRRRPSIGVTAGRAVGQDDDGVVGRGVAVDGHLVEGALDRRAQEFAERQRGDRRIGGQEGEHRRHLRMDHARRPSPCRRCGSRAHRRAAPLRLRSLGRVSVVMIARAASVPASCGRAQLERRRCVATHDGDRQPRADEAGRGRQHLVGRAAEMRGGGGHHRASIVEPAGTGSRVRAAGVDDDRARAMPPLGLERLLRHEDRRRPERGSS